MSFAVGEMSFAYGEMSFGDFGWNEFPYDLWFFCQIEVGPK